MAKETNQTCLSWLGFSNPDVSVSRYRTHAGYRITDCIFYTKKSQYKKLCLFSSTGKGKPSGDLLHNNAKWLKDIRYLISSFGEEDVKCPVYNRKLNTCLNYGNYMYKYYYPGNSLWTQNIWTGPGPVPALNRYHYKMFDTRDCTVSHEEFRGYKGLPYKDTKGKFSSQQLAPTACALCSNETPQMTNTKSM